MNQTHRICAVVVTYQCGPSVRALLDALLPQTQRIHCVDNKSDPDTISTLTAFAAMYPDHVRLTINATNLGVAAAQNQGIQQAINDGFDWILLQDDDSLPDKAMVPTLLHAWEKESDMRIGIVAPRLVEQNVPVENRYLIPWGTFGFRRVPVPTNGVLLNAATVIASGSLIHADVFRRIGLMNESYFIDYVDHEFCFRARQHNYRILVVGEAILYHHQGNKRRQSILGLSIITPHYSPERYYHLFRNRLFFLRRYALSDPFLILHEGLAYGWDMLRIVACESQKIEKLRSMIRGIIDGLIRPIPEATAIPTC